jgi:hypothetical protein
MEIDRHVVKKVSVLDVSGKLYDKDTPVKGHLRLVLTDKNGKIKDKREYENTITVLHDATIADRMAGGTDDLIDYTGVGDATGGKSTASTALESQLARVQNDSNTQGGGGDDNDVVHVSTFAAGTGTGALVEAGLFTDAGAGATLNAYQDFSVINKGAGDTLTVTWTITYGAS